MKVSKSFENRGILLKGTNRKITSQEGGFLNFLKSLMPVGLPLMKMYSHHQKKGVSIPLGLAAAASATDEAIQRKIYGSGTKALIMSNEQMEYLMKIVKSSEEAGLLIKGISEIIKNEAK